MQTGIPEHLCASTSWRSAPTSDLAPALVLLRQDCELAQFIDPPEQDDSQWVW